MTGASSAEYLTARELMERFKIPRSTFYRYLRDGYLPPGLRVGPRTVRWRRSDVEAFEARLASDRGAR